MATYSFKITKGNIQLELITTDKELLEEQFGIWVRQSGEYARQKKMNEHKENLGAKIQQEEEITKRNIEAQIGAVQTEEPAEKIPEEKKEEPPVQHEVASPKEEDLDIFYKSTEQSQPPSEDSNFNGVFDNILENSMKNPMTELTFKPSPSIKKDNAFINYINGRKIERKIDYLLLTAYYLTQFEQKPRFTLKQLNAKLMQNLAVIIDHAVLQEAINRDYIECLPDLTGLVGASEYRLTAYGEKTLMEE